MYPRPTTIIEFGIQDIILDQCDSFNENFQEKETKTKEVKDNQLSEENSSASKVILL